MGGHPMPGYRYFDENGNEVVEFEFPSQKEINEQNTPFLNVCFALYKKVKQFGLPDSRGFSFNRPTVLEICQIIEGAINEYESWSMKNGKDLTDRG